MNTLFRQITLISVLAIAVLPALATTQTPTSEEKPSAQTLAIFADRTISENQWQALVAALNRELASPEASTLPTPNMQILRGDRIPSGIEVQSTLSIYLHGDCLLPTRAYTNQSQLIRGPLGWVNRRHGQIEPFAHVDCTLLGQLLVRRAAFFNQEQQTQAMPTAIARVLLHEWIHVASQNPSHSKHGITKAEFTADDLLAPIAVTVARLAAHQSAPSPAH